MDPAHKKNLNKFMKKYRHIHGQETPSERSLRAICVGQEHLNSFLRKGVCQNEYLAIARYWIRLLDETRRKLPAQIVVQFLEQISLGFIDFLMLPTLDKGLLIHTSTVWSSLLKVDEPELISRIVNKSLEKFKNFQHILFKMGNYYCQFLATEVLTRFLLPFDTKTTKSLVDRILVGDKLQPARDLLITINLRRFDGDSRLFLNAFNDAFDEWSVFSVIAQYGKVENYTMVRPVDNGAACELWIDFNFRDFSVTFFCDGKTFAEKQNQWVFIELERKAIQDVVLKRVKEHIEITVVLNDKGQISGEERKHQFREVMFGVALNEQTAILIDQILPMFTGKPFGDTYSQLVAPKRLNPVPAKRHAKTKVLKNLMATPAIAEEEPEEGPAIVKKPVAQLFDASQKPVDYLALMDSMSNYTFDDATTNFDTIGGRTDIEEDEDDEVVNPTPEPAKTEVPKEAKGTGMLKTSSSSNKENIPPVESQPAPQPLVNHGNDHISSTVHLDESDGPPELASEIAHEYEYDTGDVDDEFGQEMEPPTPATYTIHKSKPTNPEPKEPPAKDVFDFLVEDDEPVKTKPKKTAVKPTTSRKATASQTNKKASKKAGEDTVLKTKGTPKPCPKKGSAAAQKRSRNKSYNFDLVSEAEVLEPTKRSDRIKSKSYNYNYDFDSDVEEFEPSVPKKSKSARTKPKPTTANVLLTQVLKQRNDTQTATHETQTLPAKKPTELVAPNSRAIEKNWLMKKFIDSSMDSSLMTDPDQEMDSVSNYQGVSDHNYESEQEVPATTQTYMRKVSGTTIHIQNPAEKKREPAVKILQPVVTATSKTHQMSVSKRTYNDSCDLVTTEIFQQNIKRTKISTPKVYEDPEVVTTVERCRGDNVVDEPGNVIAVGTELQTVRENLTTILQDMSTTFWKSFNESNATLNNQLVNTTRDITKFVLDNSQQLEDSYTRFREMREKEDDELKKIFHLSEANRQLASKCQQMTDTMMQTREDRMRSTHAEFSEITKTFLDRSNIELTNQWSSYKKGLIESMQNVFNNMLTDV